MATLIFRLITLFIFLLSVITLCGQETITGLVVDENTGETILGASILVKGTDQGTITDFEGLYSITVDNLFDTLQISYIGYVSQEIPIDGRTTIDITLLVNNNQLDEVVVVGYGRQKKKVVTGATARVTNEEITSTPVLRVEQALQGRTSGVQVTSQSGQPGDEPTVRIRGIGTTGVSKPLYIVDGLAVSGIDYLNPADIETIDVLKDAASAAIYGARAANGVVLITTTTGNNKHLEVTYSTYYGLQNAYRQLDMLNADEYKMMMNEGARNAGLTEPFDLLEISPHDTDWQEEMFIKNAPMKNHSISLNGGGEKSTFASSVSYFNQEGIIGGSKSQFERYTARINTTNTVNEYLSFGSNIGYTHLVKRGIEANQSFSGAYGSALNLDPLTPLFETDENILSQYPYSIEPVIKNDEGQVYGISNYIGAEVVNPLALLENENDEIRKDQLVGNAFGIIQPIKDLKFRSSLGVDLAYVLDDSFRDLFFLNGAQLNDNKTSVAKKIERFFTWQWENTASYEKQIGDHNISGLVGLTATEFNSEDLRGFNAGVPTTNPDHVYLDLATDTVWTASGGALHSALYSQFGRVQYNFKDKYSFTGIIRRDGSSRFGSNNRFGIFPSLGFAWVLSDESFIPNLGPLNYLKLRASYGINGNQEIGDYQFLSTINQERLYTIGGGAETGSSPNFVENADIRWEESEQLDIGLDFGLFENKMQGSVDFYIKNTNGLLERIAIPGHVGNDGPTANVGSVQNKGVEMNLSWTTAKSDWKYYFSINGAYNINEMTFIGNTEKVIPGASWALAGAVTRSEEGLPISYFWGYETDGLFQNQNEVFQHINQEGELLQPNAQPGDVRFVDINSDGIINEDDRAQIGNPTPDLTFGFVTSAEYKGFDASIFLQGTYGNDIFNGTQRRDLRFTNRTTDILDRWTGEGTSNTIPRFTWIDSNNNDRVSDLYIEDGSYVRVKNLQIGYSIPTRFVNKISAEKWRFYVSFENLFTFTNYSGVDPEIGAISSFDIGIDRGVYPQARITRFGTSITF